MLLVNRLLGDSQLDGNLVPVPPASTRVVDLGDLQGVDEPTQSRNGTQPFTGVSGGRVASQGLGLVHMVKVH